MPYIDGASGTSTKANIDSNYNLLVNFPISGTNGAKAAGFITSEIEADAGNITGSRLVRSLDASYDSRSRTGIDTPLFMDRFSYSGLNTTNYFVATSGMTFIQNNGFLALNSSGTIGQGVITYQSRKSFPVLQDFGLKYFTTAQFSQSPISGNVTEWGLGIVSPSGISINPSDGAFFRYSGTNLYAVTSNSNFENSSLISGALVGSGQTHQFKIDAQASNVRFSIDSNVVASINYSGLNGSGIGSEFTSASARLPIFFKTYNYTSVSAPQQMSIASIGCALEDGDAGKSWPDILSALGGNASEGQNGNPMGSTAFYTNNFNPQGSNPSGTSNILGRGLGGMVIWSGAAATGATDYIISSYQVPSGTASTPGKTLYIHGITIEAYNAGFTNGSGGLPFVMTAAYGHTSESLATTESATSKAPRFLPLGVLNMGSGIGVGNDTSSMIVFPFIAPIVINQSEYFSINTKYMGNAAILVNMIFNIGIDGYWE